MRLKKIQFENFRSFIHHEINFPSTPILIIFDKNGSGKSTIHEGVLWGLAGEIVRYNSPEFGSIDALYSFRAKKNARTRVFLEFENNQSKNILLNINRPKRSKTYLTSSQKLDQQYFFNNHLISKDSFYQQVTKELGIDPIQFQSINYLAQEIINEALIRDDNERANAFSKLLAFDWTDEIVETINNEQFEVKNHIKKLSQFIAQKSGQLEETELNKLWNDFQNNIKVLESQGLQLRNYGTIVNYDYLDRLELIQNYLDNPEKLINIRDNTTNTENILLWHQKYIEIINQSIAQLNQEVGKLNEKLDVVNKKRDTVLETIKIFHKDTRELQDLINKKKDYELLIEDFRSQRKVKKESYIKNETLLIELDTLSVNVERLYRDVTNYFNQFSSISQVDVFSENPSLDIIPAVNRVAKHIVSINTLIKDLEKKKENFNNDLKTTSDKLFEVKLKYEKNSSILQELRDIYSNVEKTKDELVSLLEHFSKTSIITLRTDNIFSKESQTYILNSVKSKIDETQTKLTYYQNERTHLEENTEKLHKKNLEFREALVKNTETLKLLQEFSEKIINNSQQYNQVLYPYTSLETLNKEIVYLEQIRENLKNKKTIYEQILVDGEKKLSEYRRIEKDLIDFGIIIESFPEKENEILYRHVSYGKDLFQSVQLYIAEQLPMLLIEQCLNTIVKFKQIASSGIKDDEISVINDLENINSDIEHAITIIPWQSQIKQLENYMVFIHQKETNVQKQTVLTNQISTLNHELEQQLQEYTQVEKDIEICATKKELLHAIPDRSGITKIGSIILIILGVLALLLQNVFLTVYGIITIILGIVCLVLLFNPKFFIANPLKPISSKQLQFIPIIYRNKIINDYNNELFKRKKEIELQINEKKQHLMELEQSYHQLQKEIDYHPVFASKISVDINSSLKAYHEYVELFKWTKNLQELITSYKQKYVYRDSIRIKKSKLLELIQSYRRLIENTTIYDQLHEDPSNSLAELVSGVDVQLKQIVDSLVKVENDIKDFYYKKESVTAIYTKLEVFEKEMLTKYSLSKEDLPEKIQNITQEQDVLSKEIDNIEKTRFEQNHQLEELNRNIATVIDQHQYLKDAESKIVALITALTSKSNFLTNKYNIPIDGLTDKIKSLELDQDQLLQVPEELKNHIKKIEDILKNFDSEIFVYDTKLHQFTNIHLNIKTLVDSIEKVKIETSNKYSISIENVDSLKLIIQSLRGQQEVLNHEIDLFSQKIDEQTFLLTETSRNHASLEAKLSTEQKELDNNLKSFDLMLNLIYSDKETILHAIQKQHTYYEMNKSLFLEKIKKIDLLKTELELIAKHFEMASFIQQRWIEKQEFVVEIEDNINVLNTRMTNLIEFSKLLETISISLQMKTEDLSKNIITSIKNDLDQYFTMLGGHQLLKSLNLEFRYIRNKLNLELNVGVDKIHAGSPKALFSNGEQISLVLALFFALIKQTLPHLDFKWVGLDEPTQYLDYSRKKAFVAFICDFAKRFDNIQMVITTADRELINIVEEIHESIIQVANVKQLVSSSFSDLSKTVFPIDISPEIINKPNNAIFEDIAHLTIEKEIFFPVNATKPNKVLSSIGDITKGREFTCKICKNSFSALTYQNTCNNSRCINEYKNSLFI